MSRKIWDHIFKLYFMVVGFFWNDFFVVFSKLLAIISLSSTQTAVCTQPIVFYWQHQCQVFLTLGCQGEANWVACFAGNVIYEQIQTSNPPLNSESSRKNRETYNCAHLWRPLRNFHMVITDHLITILWWDAVKTIHLVNKREVTIGKITKFAAACSFYLPMSLFVWEQDYNIITTRGLIDLKFW